MTRAGAGGGLARRGARGDERACARVAAPTAAAPLLLSCALLRRYSVATNFPIAWGILRVNVEDGTNEILDTGTYLFHRLHHVAQHRNLVILLRACDREPLLRLLAAHRRQ